MTKYSFNALDDRLNPLFQQHLPQGRVQALDQAFFMRKNAFMHLHKLQTSNKKEAVRNNNNG